MYSFVSGNHAFTKGYTCLLLTDTGGRHVDGYSVPPERDAKYHHKERNRHEMLLELYERVKKATRVFQKCQVSVELSYFPCLS